MGNEQTRIVEYECPSCRQQVWSWKLFEGVMCMECAGLGNLARANVERFANISAGRESLPSLSELSQLVAQALRENPAAAYHYRDAWQRAKTALWAFSPYSYVSSYYYYYSSSTTKTTTLSDGTEDGGGTEPSEQQHHDIIASFEDDEFISSILRKNAAAATETTYGLSSHQEETTTTTSKGELCDTASKDSADNAGLDVDPSQQQDALKAESRLRYMYNYFVRR